MVEVPGTADIGDWDEKLVIRFCSFTIGSRRDRKEEYKLEENAI